MIQLSMVQNRIDYHHKSSSYEIPLKVKSFLNQQR